jgi:hypothetical protein
MTKKNFKKAAKSGKVNQKHSKNTIDIVERGEVFGEAVIGILSLTATNWPGIGVATYGLAKAWAALKTVAKMQDIEVADLFSGLSDSFSKEFEEITTEIDL